MKNKQMSLKMATSCRQKQRILSTALYYYVLKIVVSAIITQKISNTLSWSVLMIGHFCPLFYMRICMENQSGQKCPKPKPKHDAPWIGYNFRIHFKWLLLPDVFFQVELHKLWVLLILASFGTVPSLLVY